MTVLLFEFLQRLKIELKKHTVNTRAVGHFEVFEFESNNNLSELNM